MHLRSGLWVSRRFYLAPIEPGTRVVVRPLLKAGTRPGACIHATAVTRRDERRDSFTVVRRPLGCLPR
jgi:hypothetical protein